MFSDVLDTYIVYKESENLALYQFSVHDVYLIHDFESSSLKFY